jgi:hypothetical protein
MALLAHLKAGFEKAALTAFVRMMVIVSAQIQQKLKSFRGVGITGHFFYVTCLPKQRTLLCRNCYYLLPFTQQKGTTNKVALARR